MSSTSSSSEINLYPFIVGGAALFLITFQLIFSKWLCIRICRPRRVDAKTTRCCWDDGAYRHIEYDPEQIKKISSIGSKCTQYFHHLLLTSSLMPTDDSIRALARHHRAACLWAVLVTPLLSVTLLMKDPSPLDLTISSPPSSSSNSSTAAVKINENVFDPSSYEMMTIIFNCVCGVAACFIGRLFWYLFASVPHPFRFIARTALEKETAERTKLEKARDFRFLVTWIFWFVWVIGCLAVFIAFGLNLPSTASNAPVMQHVVLSCVTLIVALFVIDPFFSVILVCLIPSCENCTDNISHRLIHPGLFSLSMKNSGVECPLFIEYEGTMTIEDGSGNKKNNSNSESNDNNNSKKNRDKKRRDRKNKKNNNSNNEEGDGVDGGGGGSEDDDPTARDRNMSDDCDDIEFDDELPETATREERKEYVKSKLATLDDWSVLPEETKDSSPLRVVRRSEVVRETEEEQAIREAEEARIKLEQIKSSGGLKPPTQNPDGTWNKPKFINPDAPMQKLQKKWDDEDNKNDNDDELDEDGLPKVSNDEDSKRNAELRKQQQKTNPLVVVSKTPMTPQQKKQLERTQLLDAKIHSSLSEAQKVLEDATQLEQMAETRKQRARQKELDRILGEEDTDDGQQQQQQSDGDKNNNNKPYQSALGKSLAALLGNSTRKHGTHGLSNEEQTLWETERQEIGDQEMMQMVKDINSSSNNKNEHDDDDDCDDEISGGIPLSKQVSVLNSIGIPSIVQSPQYSKNKEYQQTLQKKQMVGSKNKEFDDFFFSSGSSPSSSTTPSGARLTKQGFVKGDPEFDKLFSIDENKGPSSSSPSSQQQQQYALSPLSLRRTNGYANKNEGNNAKSLTQLGGLMDLPPSSSFSPTSASVSSSPNNKKKTKKVKLDPLDTTSEDDDSDDDEFTLPTLPQRQQEPTSSTTFISVPASPQSSSSSSPSATLSRASPRQGGGGSRAKNLVFGGGSGTRQQGEEAEHNPMFTNLAKNAFLPKVEGDGEWKMVANPWEMI